MGTPTQIYVDPSIAADSGAGTSGDPYGDLQYALNQVTRDSTNGDQFNVKNGTDEILSAALSLATYGAPSNNAPLIFRGYTSSANDGGQGGISGNASVAVFSGSEQYIVWKDMHLHNTGSANILTLNSYSTIEDCELDNTTGNGIVCNNYATILNCNIYDIDGDGVELNAGCLCSGCYFQDGSTNKFDRAIDSLAGASYGSCVTANIISLTGNGDGIGYNYAWRVEHNSIFASAGQGTGIVPTAAGRYGASVLANLVDGFSGVGGTPIDYGSNEECFVGGQNATFNCTNTIAGTQICDLGDDEDPLSATPFAKSGANNFGNRFTYFEPQDTGNVIAGGFPSGRRLDKGAVQHADPSGGTTIIQRHRRVM